MGISLMTCPDCGMLLSAGGHRHVCSRAPDFSTPTKPAINDNDVQDAVARAFTFNLWDAVTDRGLVPDAPEELKRMTIAVIVLKNGFVLTGESACADIAYYDRRMGEQTALADAERKIWPLLGYALKDRLASNQAFAAMAKSQEPDPL